MPTKNRKTLNIALVGASGRMGQEIFALAQKDPGLKIMASLTSQGPQWNEINPKQVDLVIDFSLPGACMAALDWSVQNRKPFVSGTTGLKPTHFRHLKSASRKIPVLWAANMSLGIAVFRNLLRQLTPLAEWDFQIEETHHKKKKDRPSGTAKVLQNDMTAVLRRRLPPVKSYRRGNVPGEHSLSIRSKEELIKIEHTALNRRVFARGALLVARRLFDKKRPGLYDINQIVF